MKPLEEMTHDELQGEAYDQYFNMYRAYNGTHPDLPKDASEDFRGKFAMKCLPRDRNVTMEIYRRYQNCGGDLSAKKFYQAYSAELRLPMISALREVEILDGGRWTMDPWTFKIVWEPMDPARQPH